MTNGGTKLMPPPQNGGTQGVLPNNVATTNTNGLSSGQAGSFANMTTNGRNNYKYFDVDGLGAIPEKVRNQP